MDRRSFLGVAAAGAGAIALGGAGLGSGTARLPGDPALAGYRAGVGRRPYPWSPEGTDHLPQIDHIVCVMMENHSFDNILGVLGRGDGFTMKDGKPTNSNPNKKGAQLTAFHMPTPCQTTSPSQAWNASHEQYDKGTNQGFVTSPSGPVAMGYWKRQDLPFTYSLASTFPIADQWTAHFSARRTRTGDTSSLARRSGSSMTACPPSSHLTGPSWTSSTSTGSPGAITSRTFRVFSSGTAFTGSPG